MSASQPPQPASDSCEFQLTHHPRPWHATLAALALLAAVATAQTLPQAMVRLEPDNPGPYTGDEQLTVSIYLDNLTDDQAPLIFVGLDYTASSQGLNLPSLMTWSLVPTADGDPELPTPTYQSSAFQNVLAPNGTILLGTVEIRVPRTDGCYTLDVLSPDPFGPFGPTGGEVQWQSFVGGPVVTWSSVDGTLTGGTLTIGVNQNQAELCNGLDDDCDGLVDEDFFQYQYDFQTNEIIEVGPGNPCVINRGSGNCEAQGRLACSQDGLSLECIPAEPIPNPGVEGPPLSPSCSDLDDNDCDGLTDEEDPDCHGPEICDYLDNDGDGEVDEIFILLGQPCTVGVGPCARDGIYICNDNGDGVRCSAQPIPAGVEGPPNSAKCSDGFDNDCDGLIDLDDPDCQAPEICDGLDNDGDGQIDEDFPTLGQPCTVGVGPCERTGVLICNPNGSGVICSVTPGAALPEGPGCDCANGIDDDCDGLVDLDDPDCGGIQLRAQAALPQICAAPSGCTSWHTVDWDILNPGVGLVETARLVIYDDSGQELDSVPVNKGDELRITADNGPPAISSMSATYDFDFFENVYTPCETGPDNGPLTATCSVADTDCDDDLDLADLAVLQQQFDTTREYLVVNGPLPTLVVEAQNTLGKATAFASPNPFIDIIQPSQTVVSLSEGDQLNVEVAINGVDLATLQLWIDGVEVISALGLDPGTDFPGGPYGGTFGVPGSNCIAEVCNLVVDTGDINTLAANTLTATVSNLCCGGHGFVCRAAPRDPWVYDPPLNATCYVDDMIDTDMSAGLEIQILSPADGFINPAAGLEVFGTVCHGFPLPSPTPGAGGFVRVQGALTPLGLPLIQAGDGFFTADTYRYNFEAGLSETDKLADFVSGLGVPGTLDPGSNRVIAEVIDAELNAAHDTIKVSQGPVLPGPPPLPSPLASASDPIPHGISLVLESAGLQTIVEETLAELAEMVVQETENALNGLRGTPITIPTDPCDINTTLLTDDPTPFSFTMNPEDFTFTVTPQANQLTINATSGPAQITGSVKGRCRVTFLGVCVIKVKAKLGATIDIAKAQVDVTLTETDLEDKATVTPTLTINNNDVNVTINDVGSDIGCIGGVILDVLTFGQIENIIEAIAKPIIQDYLNSLDLQPYIALIPVPPIPLDLLEVDPIDVEALGISFAFDLSDVEINPSGLTAGLETQFLPLVIDPEVEVTPGPLDTIAPLPLPVLPNPLAREATVLVADDALNQLVYAMTRNGIIKTDFSDVRPLGSLLPANCGTLPPPAEGQCAALKGVDCTTLGTPDAQLACLVTQQLLASLNLADTTPTIFHGRTDIAPKFFIFRSLAPNGARLYLRLSQVFVGAVADRDGDGVVAEPYSAIPSCFGGNPATGTPCALVGACYDVTFIIDAVISGGGDSRQLTFDLVDVDLSTATGCSGGVSFPGGLDAFEDIFAGLVFQQIESIIQNEVPPIDLGGLSFGGLIQLENLTALTEGNAFDPTFEDAFGLSADPAPVP
jgi:hypothetical protein